MKSPGNDCNSLAHFYPHLIPIPAIIWPMVYPLPFLRLAVSGTIHTDEAFSWSLSLVPDTVSAPTVPTEVPAALITAINAFHQSPGFISNQAKINLVKLNRIGVDGRYTSTTGTIRNDYVSPVPGGFASPYPSQIAVAVSLRTHLERGRAHAGRFYVPMPVYAIGATDGKISIADADSIGGYVTAFLNSVNAAVPGWRVGVASNMGTGRFEGVTHVKVGRVLDTMRSRRASKVEGYRDGAVLTGDWGGAGGMF